MAKTLKHEIAKVFYQYKIQIFKKWIPFLLCFSLVCFSLVQFVTRYGFWATVSINDYIYVDFYMFLGIFFVAVCLLFCFQNFYMQFLACVLGLISAIFMLYTQGELFTIKSLIFVVWTVVIMLHVAWGFNFFVTIANLAVLIAFQFHPSFLGALEQEALLSEPSYQDVITLCFYLLCTIICTATYRYISESWETQIDKASHLNLAMTQLSVFNQELQNVAKLSGKEAAHEERMRITRDMHDSCGYVFVNIIALTEAAESNREISKDQISETFSTVRNLAKNGLKQTRATLHAIHDMQNPIETSIDSIYDIKSIFEKATGINVTIHTGNIKKDYGRTINSIIIRTMQEALTNAIRHGMANNVYIDFRDEDSELIMKVEDDGIGSSKIVKGIGLAGMEGRLAKIGGVLEVWSVKHAGFKIVIRIPLLKEELGA